MSETYAEKYHNLECPACGADLTKGDSVDIHVSICGHEFDVSSHLLNNGLLCDSGRLVENGYHAGTYCNCGEWLEETLPDVPIWATLSAQIDKMDSGEQSEKVLVLVDGEYRTCVGFEQCTDNYHGMDKSLVGKWFLFVE